jgi:transcription antitermination factor NusG
MFPGYVFVRFNAKDQVHVVSTPGMARMVTVAGSAAPIPREDIDNVRPFAEPIAETGLLPEPEPLVEKGQVVRIARGTFGGITGIVIEHRGAGQVLVQVGLKAIGQGMKVEVESRDIEPDTDDG